MALRVVKVTPGRLVNGRFVPAKKNPGFFGDRTPAEIRKMKAEDRAIIRRDRAEHKKLEREYHRLKKREAKIRARQNPEKKTRAGIRAKKKRFREMLAAKRKSIKNSAADARSGGLYAGLSGNYETGSAAWSDEKSNFEGKGRKSFMAGYRAGVKQRKKQGGS